MENISHYCLCKCDPFTSGAVTTCLYTSRPLDILGKKMNHQITLGKLWKSEKNVDGIFDNSLKYVAQVTKPLQGKKEKNYNEDREIQEKW